MIVSFKENWEFGMKNKIIINNESKIKNECYEGDV